MIIYFSGSGNSKFVAKRIATALQDDLVNLGDLMKNDDRRPLISKPQRPFVFVTPCYAGRAPRAVTAFLKKIELRGDARLYYIMTAGANVGTAGPRLKKFFVKKGMQFMGFGIVKMPENYLMAYNTPDKKHCMTVLSKALPIIDLYSSKIKMNERITADPKMTMAPFQSEILNPFFYATAITCKGFYATAKCNGCGDCEKRCPLNVITMVNERPVWKGNCTHCTACINGCPVEAIEFKNQTQGRNRYFLNS